MFILAVQWFLIGENMELQPEIFSAGKYNYTSGLALLEWKVDISVVLHFILNDIFTLKFHQKHGVESPK